MGKGNVVHRYFHCPQGRAHGYVCECVCACVCERVCNVCVVVRGLVTVSQQGIQAVVVVWCDSFPAVIGARGSSGVGRGKSESGSSVGNVQKFKYAKFY